MKVLSLHITCINHLLSEFSNTSIVDDYHRGYSSSQLVIDQSIEKNMFFSEDNPDYVKSWKEQSSILVTTPDTRTRRQVIERQYEV